MAKTYLGIDVGHDMLKMALVKGNQVKNYVQKERFLPGEVK